MKKTDMKAMFELAVKNDDKPAIMKMLNPVIENLAEAIKAGVLIKNVKANLSNKGITGKACEMITEMAIIRAESFMHNKAV